MEHDEDESVAMEHDEDEKVKMNMNTLCEFVSERLYTSVPKLISLIQDFDKHIITQGEFTKSIQLFFAKKGQEHEDGKTQQDVEEGEIGQDHLHGDPKIESNHLAIRAKLAGNSKKHPTIHIRFKEEDVSSDKREPEKHVTNVVFNLEEKNRRILQLERSFKKTRTSTRLEERVTPSYRLIPEEEQCPVSDTVLNNNKYCLMRFDDPSGHKKLTDYEVAMATCEEDMFEVDMLMEALRSAVESAQRVISGEMRMEDLGVKFYRCIEMLYQGDMTEIVREDHKMALPVILNRLKQKLDKLTVAREEWKPQWKQVFEENAAKQRASTAQGHRKKVMENNKNGIRF